MKYFILILTMIMAPAFQGAAQEPVPADPKKTAAVHVDAAGVLLKAARPDLDAVREAYAKALAVPGLPVGERVRILNLAAEVEKRLGKAGAEAARLIYERIAADPEAPNKARIAALNGAANALIVGMAGLELHRMDIDAAEAILKRALELPELKPDEAAEAWINLGRLQERRDHLVEARASYQMSAKVDTNERARVTAQRLLGGIAGMEREAAEPGANARAEREEALSVLNNPASDDKARWNAFIRLPSWRDRDPGAVRADGEKWMPVLLPVDANRALQLLPKFREATKSDPAFVAWAGPLLMAAPRLSSNDYALVRVALLTGMARQGKVKEAGAEATAMAADVRLPLPLRYQSALTAAVLASREAAVVNALKKVAVPEGLTPGQRSQAVLEAARLALAAGLETAARSLFNEYRQFFVNPETASLVCDFVSRAPRGVEGWLTSARVKDPKKGAKLDRPYGDNLKFLLETDSAVMSRNIGEAAEGAKEDDIRTDVHAVCDPEGIHVFFMAHDSRAAEAVNQFVTGGSYEGYLAPGRYRPYTFFSIDLPSGALNDRFYTVYPNRWERQALQEEGTLAVETRVVEGGYATVLTFSWDAFYDKLPKDGEAWAFENIRWTRAGGFSFGGSESVHNPSSWGDLVFAGLTAENLRAIRKRQVYRAAAVYAKTRRDPGGPVLWWSDSQLGDPAFYAAEVKPLVESLDAQAKQVTADLAPEQVDRLFEMAVPGWLELPRIAAEKRRDWLLAQFTAGDLKAP